MAVTIAPMRSVSEDNSLHTSLVLGAFFKEEGSEGERNILIL